MLLAVKDTENSPDFSIIEPDGNSIKIEQIREFQKKVSEKPIISNKKVYIINDSDKMTVEAQNCLLKTLEEPPEFAKIILIGSNESSFLSTIKSRCTIIKFNPISDEQVKGYIKEKYELPEISESIILASSGSIGKAEILKDKQELFSSIDKVINNIEQMDLIDTLKNADIIYKSQEDKQDILEYININNNFNKNHLITVLLEDANNSNIKIKRGEILLWEDTLFQ